MDNCIYCKKKLKYKEECLKELYWANIMCPSCFGARIRNIRMVEELKKEEENE